MITEQLEQERDNLAARAREIRGTLEGQLGILTKDLMKAKNSLLVIAGVAVAGFIVYRVLSGPARRKVRTENGGFAMVAKTRENPFVTMIKSAIASFLLSVAREKLVSYLESLNSKHEAHTANTAQGAA